MSLLLLRVAAVVYVAAACSYLVHVARPRIMASATVGFWLLAAAFLVHAVSIGVGCKELGGAEFFTMRGGFVMIAWLAGGAYLALHRVYKIPVVGGFVTPLILMALIPAISGPSAGSAVPHSSIHSSWLPIHVSTAFLGIAMFALAFGVALMYLLMEREVKGKHFGALFSRLPSLDKLDLMNQRLVRWGFLAFTVALVTGAFFARQAWGSFWEWDPKQVFSLVSWALYGGLVQARYTAGWHGRRVAWLTMVGFLLVIGSFVGLGVFEAGKHGGDWQ